MITIMKPINTALILILFALSFFVLAGQAQEHPAPVLVLNLEGPLTPAMSEYLQRGVTTAEQGDYQALILQLNTPGGNITHMQRMVSIIRSSQVPIIVFISPRGAIAGSAGTIITLAGHRAAMAPETAVGAASPVGFQGEDLGETARSKTEEIIKAQIRTLAETRGKRAVAFAEQTVETAQAATAREAFQVGLIDYLAADIPDLLGQLDGDGIQVSGKTILLSTNNARADHLKLSLIEQLLQLLTDPNILFILITIGVQAILIELSHPGAWVPGFVGAVSLALAGYGLGILSVNWFGLIFLVIAFVLFVLDLKAPTHGALTAAGVGALIIGALVLFNSPGTPEFQRVSIALVLISSLLTGGVFGVVTTFALRAQRSPILTGREALSGKKGFARSRISPLEKGQVQIAGERWSAILAPGEEEIFPGDQVVITGTSGNYVVVQKIE